jgi:hypothetical protein
MRSILFFALGWAAATLFYFGLWVLTEVANLDDFIESVFF